MSNERIIVLLSAYRLREDEKSRTSPQIAEGSVCGVNTFVSLTWLK